MLHKSRAMTFLMILSLVGLSVVVACTSTSATEEERNTSAGEQSTPSVQPTPLPTTTTADPAGTGTTPPGAIEPDASSPSPSASPTPSPLSDDTTPTASVAPIAPLDTSTTTPSADSGSYLPMVEPDPDYQQALNRASFSTREWRTDFSRHSIPYNEIISGGVGRDGIPPIDEPKFTTIDDANQWLDPLEPVISLELEGEARAYPLQIMTWHEIVNDQVGEVPVTVTFCPLCNSAIVFDRRLEGRVYDFGVSGNLRNSDLVMWDRQTQSWWQQFTGEAVVGVLTGRRLSFIPAAVISWQEFKDAYPAGRVLSQETGHSRPYGDNPYAGYDRVDNPPFLFTGELDGRLLPMERVAAVTVGDRDLAFPFTLLREERVVNYSVNGHDFVVLFGPDTLSALDRRYIPDSRSVGSTGVFEAELDGQKLTFELKDEQFVDQETGTTWNLLGKALEGSLAGSQLKPIVHANHFWFSWAAFKPDTVIYQGSGR